MRILNFPEEFRVCSTCYITGPYNQHEVDWVVCTQKGYILEIKGKIVVNNCFTGVCDVKDAEIFYEFDFNDDFLIYYVLRGENGDLLVVSRRQNNLKVIERRDGVDKFRIADFENSGRPKLLIYKDLNNFEVWSGFEEQFSGNVGKLDNDSVKKNIPLALHDLRQQLDNLQKELVFRKALIRRRLDQKCLEKNYLPFVLSNDDNFVENKQFLMITDTWERIYGNFWINAIQIQNTSKRAVGKLSVIASSILEYQWSVSHPDWTNAESTIPPSASFLIIIAAKLDSLDTIRKVNNCYEVRYDGGVFSSPEFRLTPKKFISGDFRLFRAGFLAEDRMCLKLTHICCQLDVELKITSSNVLVDNLKMDLNLHDLDVSYLTSYNSNIAGLLLKYEYINAYHLYIQLWTQTKEQLLLLVSAIKEIAPYDAKIEVTS